MIKRLLLPLILILSVLSGHSQNNSVKGFFFWKFPFEESDYYFSSIAFEKSIFKKASLQLSYSGNGADICCSGSANLKSLSFQFRYYITVDKKVNPYVCLYDNYINAFCEGYTLGYDTTWNDDNTYDVYEGEKHYERNYYLNGIGLGGGIKVKLSKRTFIDLQLSSRYFVHENKMKAYNNVNNFMPIHLYKWGINGNLMFGFKLF